jgi:hypothetical protein
MKLSAAPLVDERWPAESRIGTGRQRFATGRRRVGASQASRVGGRRLQADSVSDSLKVPPEVATDKAIGAGF